MTQDSDVISANATSFTWKRVRIQGTLTLTSPLILGDGTTRDGRKNADGVVPQIACVARDSNGRAMIPGASLKGALRSSLQRHHVNASAIEKLFGRESNEKDRTGKSSDSGQGGCVEFGYSYSTTSLTNQEMDEHIEQSVVIDRVTRSASDRLLFAQETIPPGTVFPVELLGFGVSDEHVSILLYALDGFNDQSRRIQLGSGTANDYGQARWTMSSVLALSDAEIARWLSSSEGADHWSFGVVPKLTANVSVQVRSAIRFEIGLHFASWFLVRDPQHAKVTESDSEDDGLQNNDSQVGANDKSLSHHETKSSDYDAFPRLNGDKNVILPARGFRGVFRSQLERIARTLNPNAGGDPVRDSIPGIVEALFGFSGGKTAVRCSSFVDSKRSHLVAQNADGALVIPDDVQNGRLRPLFPREFVAIDRFTGAAADHFKFDCVAAWQPVLSGSIAIDLGDLTLRCEQTSSHQKAKPITPAAALGLLFLTLRDLTEGDLSFGMGAAKGFGQCRANIMASVASAAESDWTTLVAPPLGISPPVGTTSLMADPWFALFANACIHEAQIWLKPSR